MEMSPEEFKNHWITEYYSLIHFSEHAVDLLRISAPSKTFLKTAGLPKDAAPFLSFGGPRLAAIPSVSHVWKKDAEFERYRMIGSNGSGDPICIDEDRNGGVYYLNHDNKWISIFMNSSVEQLAYSLLAYRKLGEETRKQGKDDDWLNGNIPPALSQLFISELEAIDSKATDRGTFWNEILGEFSK